MAYYNNTNYTNYTNFHPNPPADGGYNLYSLPTSTPATEGIHGKALGLSFDPSSDFGPTVDLIPAPNLPTVDQQSTVSSHAAPWLEGRYNLFVDENLTCEFPEPVAPATSYGCESQGNGYGHSQPSGWSTIEQWPQYDHPDFSSQECSFAGVTAKMQVVATTTPNSGKDPS